MSILTVKVDDKLKDQAESVLEELGLDIPTAVRMYLKSIVRENGLPSDLMTGAGSENPRASSPKANTAESVKEKKTTAAPTPAVKVGTDAFVELICSVPDGFLTRWSDMEDYLSVQMRAPVSRPSRAEWPKTNADGLVIPYWRVVSERGAVRGDPETCSRELQEEMLKTEGHTFVESGHGVFSGIKVADYKHKLVIF